MDVRDVRRTLTGKLGAAEDRGGHHVFYYLQYQGEEYMGSKLSHSWRGDLNDYQIDLIKKPLFLNTAEFQELVACPLTREAFFNLWSQRKGLTLS